jgi:flagellin
MGLKLGIGAADVSYNLNVAQKRFNGASTTLGRGFNSDNVGDSAFVMAADRGIKLAKAYSNNIVNATSYLSTAKSYLQEVRNRLADMNSLAIQSSSASASNRAVLQAQNAGLKTSIINLLATANFNGTLLFTSPTVGNNFSVGVSATVSGDIDIVNGTALNVTPVITAAIGAPAGGAMVDNLSNAIAAIPLITSAVADIEKVILDIDVSLSLLTGAGEINDANTRDLQVASDNITAPDASNLLTEMSKAQLSMQYLAAIMGAQHTVDQATLTAARGILSN